MLNYVGLSGQPSLINILQGFKEKLLYNELNCCRVAIVNEFYPETLEVQVNIVNKMVINMKEDGSQVLEDYAPITAKICYAGNGISYPLKQGDCGLLLFNDREIESWYVNGEINQLAYNRCHSLTDAIFIVGMYAQPNTANAQYIENCLHIFYGTKGIKITDVGLEIDGDTIINGNLVVNGTLSVSGDATIGGISFLNHTHVCSGPGGNSGTPQ